MLYIFASKLPCFNSFVWVLFSFFSMKKSHSIKPSSGCSRKLACVRDLVENQSFLCSWGSSSPIPPLKHLNPSRNKTVRKLISLGTPPSSRYLTARINTSQPIALALSNCNVIILNARLTTSCREDAKSFSSKAELSHDVTAKS